MTWCYECSSSPSIPVFIIGTCVSWRLSIVTPYEQLPLLFRHCRTLLRRRVCPSYPSRRITQNSARGSGSSVPWYIASQPGC